MVSDDIRERVVSYIRHQAGKSRAAVIDLVSTNQAELLKIMAGVDAAMVERQPTPDEWSLHELLRHVIAAEGAVATLIEKLARSEQPPELRRAIGMMGDDSSASFAALVERLRDVNQRLLDVISALPPEPDMSMQAVHPFFGDLNCMEWAVFQRIHDADHIQHAGKILAALSASPS